MQESPRFSLIIPVYNEADHLEEFLIAVNKLEFEVPHELVFIDDCSKDGSADILKKFNFKTTTQNIYLEKNGGKGAAIRKGIELASGEFIVIQDADFEYDFKDIPKLLKPLIEERADVVYGSRFQSGAHQVHRTFHYLINRILTLFSNLMSGLYLSDMETCYKVFRADLLKNLNLESNRFGFEPEITAKVGHLKIRIHEYPISYFPRNYIEGKKITWKDGLAALWHIAYFNTVGIKGAYKESLPEKYIPKGANWL